MSKFLFVYRSSPDSMSGEASPEQIQQIMSTWQAWFQQVGDRLVDGGDGLLPVGKQVREGGAVTDGPFIEGKEIVGGYSIVEVESIDEAVELSKTCPIFHGGGWVEIRQLAGFS
ncbi:MAG: YciI family protein [Planctomycetota bacterium]